MTENYELDDERLTELLERAADGDPEAEEVLIRASAKVLEQMAYGS